MMEHPQKKVGKISTTFAVICLLALPLVALSALSYEEKATNGEVLETGPQEFDHNGRALFKSYYQLTVDYLLGTSTERTLAEYYSRREYPGAPPFIPHKVKEVNSQKVNCLACHAKGVWAEEFKRHTPLTPHPELV
ncbi:MAG: nitrate reductase cytochrome c-type subunit [Deltaproteobacteria bacterium]|nr:nitrate reductase cytochrome c-type subunit [Deltaproteobacteria bacterium]MBW2136051.1 nitrate reductase cytochrome c-type subunit [Deltaproteobacteria bacterium]